TAPRFGVRFNFNSVPQIDQPSVPSMVIVAFASPHSRLLPRTRARIRAHPAAVYNVAVTSSGSIRKLASADFPTRWGRFRIHGFEAAFGDANDRPKEEAVALVMGDVLSSPPLVRIHSQCLTGDVFASLRCDCRQQLEMALSMIAEQGAGVLIYEQQEGRG